MAWELLTNYRSKAAVASLSRKFTETNVNNMNNSFTNKNNNPPAATSFAQPNGGGGGES